MNATPQKQASILPAVIVFLVIFAFITASIVAISYFYILPTVKKDPSINTSISISKEVSALFDKTSKNFAEGKYQDQLKTAEEALSKSSTDKEKAISYYWRGLAKYKLAGTSDKSNAQQDLLTATQLDPKYAGPYVTLSAIQMDTGNFQKSLELAQKCAELDPKYAWCYNNIGLSLYYMGQKEEGIKQLEKAVSLTPDSLVFRDNLNRAKLAK